MLNIISNKELTKILIGNEEKVFETCKDDRWNCFTVEKDSKEIVVNEGDNIIFITESGEQKTGLVKKISGKGAKTKFNLISTDSECEEIWGIERIEENTLSLVEED